MTIARSSSWLLLMLLIILITAYLSIPWDDLDATLHSQIAHANQTWNANTIQEAIRTGRCKPMVYACRNVTYALCHLMNGKMAGLILGIDPRTGRWTKITGYEGTKKYWERKVNGCSLLSQ